MTRRRPKKPVDEAKDAKAETGAQPADGEKKMAKAKAARPVPKPFDPTKATDAELEVLEKLAARRSSLDQRARDLDMRETLLRATEARIDGKIDELRKIKKTIGGLLKRHDAETEAKMKSLVKIYESMKPKDAARIFEKLDIGVLLDVVERMREARTAPILAKMSAAKAKTVTTALASRRALPKVRKKASKSTTK